MTDLLTNPIDTGDIPALPGETTTRILLPGEAVTRDLRHAIHARRPDATGEIPALVDVPLGLTTADLTPAAYSPEPGEPPRPLPVPPPVPGPPPPAVPTEVLSLLDSLAGDPPPPRPLPAPGPPPKPAGFVPRHRAIEPVWAWALAGAGAMLILIAVLVSSILAVRL